MEELGHVYPRPMWPKLPLGMAPSSAAGQVQLTAKKLAGVDRCPTPGALSDQILSSTASSRPSFNPPPVA